MTWGFFVQSVLQFAARTMVNWACSASMDANRSPEAECADLEKLTCCLDSQEDGCVQGRP